MDQELLARIKNAERWKSFVGHLEEPDKEALQNISTFEDFNSFAEERHIGDALSLWSAREDYLRYSHTPLSQEESQEDEKEGKERSHDGGHSGNVDPRNLDELEKAADDYAQRETDKWAKLPEDKAVQTEREQLEQEVRQSRLRALNAQGEELKAIQQKVANLRARQAALSPEERKKRYHAEARQKYYDDFASKNPSAAKRFYDKALEREKLPEEESVRKEREKVEKELTKNRLKMAGAKGKKLKAAQLKVKALEARQRFFTPEEREKRRARLAGAIQRSLFERSKKALGKTSYPGQYTIQPEIPISYPRHQAQRLRTTSVSWAPRRPTLNNPLTPKWVGAGRNPAARGLARRGASKLGKKLLKKVAVKTAERAVIGGVLGTLGLPFIIIGGFILLIIILFVLILLLIFGAGATTAKPADLPEGINYYLLAPPRVENGQNINYQILFTYNSASANVPPLNSISLVNRIPPEASFVSASNPHLYSEEEASVTWKISDFSPISVQDTLRTYRFEIVLHPEENNILVVNSICLAIERESGQELICPDFVGEDDPVSELPIPPCGPELDSALEVLNITTNVTVCEKRQLVYGAVSKFLSYPNLSLMFGKTTINIENYVGDEACGNNTNWNACTSSSRIRLKNFEQSTDTAYWNYVMYHELFHVLENRNTTIYSLYKAKLPDLEQEDSNCYRSAPGGLVIKSYELDTQTSNESAQESYAESGALYFIGGRRNIPNFETQCPSNWDLWQEVIGQQPVGAGARCTPGSTNTCGGVYNIAKNPDGVNFGDPNCELVSGGRQNKQMVADEIKRQLQTLGKTKDYCKWTCIAHGESGFDPNSINKNATRAHGAWGLFQMSPWACYPSNNPYRYNRTGNVDWRSQIKRALDLEYKMLEPNNLDWRYWSTARERNPNSCFHQPDWRTGVVCPRNGGVD